MSQMVTFPKWKIQRSLLMKACYPELAKMHGRRGVADVLRAHLDKLREDGVRVDLKPGDTFTVDNVKVVFE